MKYISRINQAQSQFLKLTLSLVILSTGTTCFELVFDFLIFNRPGTDYPEFYHEYYPTLGANLCVFFLLRSRWTGAPFVMPLFMWILFSRVSHPVPPSIYSKLESLAYMIGVVTDLAIWIMMFFLIWLSALKLRYLNRLQQYLKKNPDSTQALAEQAAVTKSAAQTLPKIGLHFYSNASPWDTSRQALLVVIGLLLLVSPVLSIFQLVPTNVKFALKYQSISGVVYDYASLVLLPALFSVFASVMIFKKWKPISYLIPLQIIFLWASAFLWQVFENSMPHELIANTLGKYTDRVLIGLILLNTLLLPIDWIKGFIAKKTAQAS